MTTNKTVGREIHVRLSPTTFYTRLGCTICGDWTEKDPVLAEFEDADGDSHYMCRDCLWAGADAVVSRLKERAGELEAWAAFLRSMAGERWVIPTHEEWETVARLDPIDAIRGKGDEPGEFIPSAEEPF